MGDYAEAREPSFIRTADPMARDVIRRSMTRNSHYSHASVSASTRSWVYSTQQNPPPPPVEPIAVPSPVRTPRPLPDPQLQPQAHPQLLHTTNGVDSADEEEYMNIDPNGAGMDDGYYTEGLGRGRSPRFVSTSPVPARGEGGSRSFVGGFVNGLRRLPKVVMRYGGSGEKRKFVRRGTFGTEGTDTSVTGMTTGNTLPRYTSNPSTPVAGPSNVHYVQAMSMPAPPMPETLPQGTVGSGIGSQRRRQPSFRITPPSEVTEPDETHEYPFPEVEPPQFAQVVGSSRTNADTATVMVYSDSQHEMPPIEEGPNPTPNRRSPSVSRPPPPQDESRVPTPTQSPVLAHLPPAEDYRRMALSSPNSPITLTTTIMSSEPSFSSELNPIKRFFHTLHTMPWIAHDRVTVDYRPGGKSGGRRAGGTKKPMASWYRGKPGLVTSAPTGSGDVDLLSGGSASRRTSANTSLTPLATPRTDRSRHHSSDHRRRRREHHHHRDRDHREHHSRRRDTTSTGAESEMMHQRSTSPILPAVYPYPYPYPYGYPTFPSPTTQHHRAYSQSTPRGPRSHRTPTYPHGYAQYQPPPHAPPLYVFQQSPTPTAGSGELSQGQGQVVSPVYVPMQLVPSTFNPEGLGNSLTSSPTVRPAATQPQPT